MTRIMRFRFFRLLSLDLGSVIGLTAAAMVACQAGRVAWYHARPDRTQREASRTWSGAG